jgi:hypothetical protein
LLATSKAELRLLIPFVLPPVSFGGGGWGEILKRLPEISKKQAGTLKVLFETLKMQKNVKPIGAYTESTDLIFKAFKKIIHLVTLSLAWPSWKQTDIS